MASTRDTIVSQIPDHIIDSHPRFLDFLEAYYEWLNRDGNPYQRVKDHMDYLSFEKSMDDYVDSMKQEYLTDVPEDVLVNKELFIKWSKKFNIARGSHASYKFLFRLLFNEQDTSIYVPKENILRTSDGSWVSNESLMILTNSGDQDKFQFQKIYQERQIYKDIYEYAYAVVQRVRVKYAGRYSLMELAVTDIEGEFKLDFPVKTEVGGEEWLVPSVSRVDINNAGQSYQVGERVLIDNLNENTIGRKADQAGIFDTRISSFYRDVNSAFVNGTAITDYTFDGRYLTSPSISVGDTVTVGLPAYQGYLVVDDTGENGEVVSIDILDLPVGVSETHSVTVDGIGQGATATAVRGLTKGLDGYYEDTKGHLSSNMYLQDSFFYQDYSYAIRTELNFDKYADIVKQVLHPSGFAMFGQINIISIIELILTMVAEIQDTIAPVDYDILHKYGMGPNHSFIGKLKDRLSLRLYRDYHLNTRETVFVEGEPGYNLESLTYADRFDYYEYQPKKGWMERDNLSDYHLYIPQDYTEEKDSGDTYFETGYVSTN